MGLIKDIYIYGEIKQKKYNNQQTYFKIYLYLNFSIYSYNNHIYQIHRLSPFIHPPTFLTSVLTNTLFLYMHQLHFTFIIIIIIFIIYIYMSTIQKKQNQIEFYGSNRGDIQLSQRQYYDMVNPLLDQRVSPHMLMKLKNLYQINSYGMFAVGAVTFPFAYFSAKWFIGPVNRGLGNKRALWSTLSITFPLFALFFSSVPIPRKLYTDILTDNSTDGTYIRNVLKDRKPALWRRISKQLFHLNYQFPQMNEYRSATQFPRDFVNERVV